MAGVFPGGPDPVGLGGIYQSLSWLVNQLEAQGVSLSQIQQLQQRVQSSAASNHLNQAREALNEALRAHSLTERYRQLHEQNYAKARKLHHHPGPTQAQLDLAGKLDVMDPRTFHSLQGRFVGKPLMDAVNSSRGVHDVMDGGIREHVDSGFKHVTMQMRRMDDPEAFVRVPRRRGYGGLDTIMYPRDLDERSNPKILADPDVRDPFYKANLQEYAQLDKNYNGKFFTEHISHKDPFHTNLAKQYRQALDIEEDMRRELVRDDRYMTQAERHAYEAEPISGLPAAHRHGADTFELDKEVSAKNDILELTARAGGAKPDDDIQERAPDQNLPDSIEVDEPVGAPEFATLENLEVPLTQAQQAMFDALDAHIAARRNPPKPTVKLPPADPAPGAPDAAKTAMQVEDPLHNLGGNVPVPGGQPVQGEELAPSTPEKSHSGKADKIKKPRKKPYHKGTHSPYVQLLQTHQINLGDVIDELPGCSHTNSMHSMPNGMARGPLCALKRYSQLSKETVVPAPGDTKRWRRLLRQFRMMGIKP